MDALARLEPVARPLLRQVDAALATLGAPAEHQVWSLLRTLGTTPADAVSYFADLRPAAVRGVAEALREWTEAYIGAGIPIDVAWMGAAGDAYRLEAAALAGHLTGHGRTTPGESMLGRLQATASYVEHVADWIEAARDRIARALAEVLSSTQAVRLRSGAAPGSGIEQLTRAAAGAPGEAVLAAAEIGVWVLTAAEDALAAGRDVLGRSCDELGEVGYRPAAHRSSQIGATLHLAH